MKYHFFLKDVPLMILLGIAAVVAAGHHDAPAKLISYQATREGLGAYDGDIIEAEESGETEAEPEEEISKDIGTPLADNGYAYAIRVNKTQNVVTVYTVDDEGSYTKPYKAMVCSVGLKGNTPIGVFDLGDRAEWMSLEGDVYGQYCTRITGDILFHSVPYFTQNKNDLEIEEYNKLGQSVSAGCVRLSVVDAKWIYDHCMEGTYVEIYESDYAGPMGKPVPAVVSSGGTDGNWDPTDPDRENPYMSNIPMIVGAYDREMERYGELNILAGISALDSEGVDITPDIKVEGSVDTETCGTYKLTYSVKDSKGLTGTATANIIVKDEEPPSIVVDQKVKSIGMYDVTTVQEIYDLLIQNVTAFDGGKQLDESCIAVDYSELLEKGYGDCAVKYRAKDLSGNLSDVVTLMVNVDLEAPVIELVNSNPGIIHLSNVLDDDYLMGLIRVTDNSGDAKVTISRPLKALDNEPYVVMYCAKDAFGNVSTLSVTFRLNES